MKKLAWGLIGCGDIARKRIAPALRSGTRHTRFAPRRVQFPLDWRSWRIPRDEQRRGHRWHRHPQADADSARTGRAKRLPPCCAGDRRCRRRRRHRAGKSRAFDGRARSRKSCELHRALRMDRGRMEIGRGLPDPHTTNSRTLRVFASCALRRSAAST